MALFSKLRGGSKGPDTKIAKAILAPVVLTAAADGSIDEAEIHQLNNLCGFSPIFGPLGPKVVGDLVKEILGDLKSKGADAVITSAAGDLSPALRETSFCFCMRIAMADGVLDEGEKNVLAGTAERMALAPETFNKIVEVVAMMQRPATA